MIPDFVGFAALIVVLLGGIHVWRDRVRALLQVQDLLLAIVYPLDTLASKAFLRGTGKTPGTYLRYNRTDLIGRFWLRTEKAADWLANRLGTLAWRVEDFALGRSKYNPWAFGNLPAASPSRYYDDLEYPYDDDDFLPDEPDEIHRRPVSY